MQSAKNMIMVGLLGCSLMRCGYYGPVQRTARPVVVVEEWVNYREKPVTNSEPQSPPHKSISHPDLSFHHLEEARHFGRRYGIDHRFLMALMQVESSGRCEAASHAGAYGLFQITLPTARVYDKRATRQKLFQSSYNIDIACQHYRWLEAQLDKHFPRMSERQKMRLIVAAWNAGLRAVIDHGGVPHFPESQQLVKRFERKYNEYTRLGI